MKNLKVFVEVKKNLYEFFIQENALCRSLAVCLQENEKSSFTLLFEDIYIFLSCDG